MIELVFVIVIIGIMAAVAVPKLAVTRTDAKISAEVANAKVTLNNLGAEFLTRDGFVRYTENDANNKVHCFTFSTENDGNVTIAMIANPNGECPDGIYHHVKNLASKNNILNVDGLAKVYQFGGIKIKK